MQDLHVLLPKTSALRQVVTEALHTIVQANPDATLITTGFGISDQRNSELPSVLTKDLRASLLRWLAPLMIWRDDDLRLHKEGVDCSPKGGGYGIALEPHPLGLKPA